MDNKLRTFENAAFGKIRTLTIGGEPWFVAVDVWQGVGDWKAHRCYAPSGCR